MFDLTSPDIIQNIFKKYNFAPNKFLGQNFLIDKKVLEKIIETAQIKEGDNVIEIGPGLGVLTQALLSKGANVAAIEKDKDLIPALRENLREYKNYKILNDDFLTLDPEKLILGFSGKPYKIVSNIPYYITSPVLRKILSADTKPQEIVFLVQREVAERIAAEPGQMSLISVFVQFYGTPSVAGIARPESFWPKPKVESAILKTIIDKKPALAGDELKNFWRLAKIGFSSRRKTLANNLAAGFHIKPPEVRDRLKLMGFNDKTRAQELTMENWLKLSEKARFS